MDRVTRHRIQTLAALSLLAIAPLGAQTPVVSVARVTPVRSLSSWPGVSLVADQSAHTVVVAVTRGPRQTAVQVLSPVDPTRASAVRKGKRLPVRPLTANELTHLMSYGSSPLILAFASKTQPNLDAFVQQNRWAPDMVLDTATTSVQDVIGVLGRELFGDDAAVSTLVTEAASPRLLAAEAQAFSFVERCQNVATQFWNGAASSVPSGNVSFTGDLGIRGYPDWNWGPGTLISGQPFTVTPRQIVGSACIDARLAVLPAPMPGTPGRPVPAPGTSPTMPEVKGPAVTDKPVEAIPKHMAPGPVVYPPTPKPPR